MKNVKAYGRKALMLCMTFLMLTILLFLFGCEHEHTELVVSGTPATCTENGYTDKVICSECDEVILDSQIIEALGHSLETIQGVDATCTINGSTEGKRCTRCEQVIVEPTVILAGHKEEIIPRVEPSIGASGSTEGKRCSACNEIFVAPCEISLLSIEVDGDSSQTGIISGNLTFNKLSGEFSLYYADENRERLDYYDALASFTSTDSANTLLFENLIIPSNCKYIVASNGGEYEYFAKIPEDRLLSDLDYKFGSLSDVHYNKGDYFNDALDFLDGCDIDFVGVCGDLTDDGEIELLEKFNEAIKDRLYKVYTTSGNHDTDAIQSGDWKENINTSITTDNEIISIANNGIDFVFAPEKSENNVFVFLCQTHWRYTKYPDAQRYTILDEEQISWLSAVLEEHKDKNVFLYFHTFLSAPDGTQESAVGNLRNPGGYAYDLPFSYGSADEIAFRALMKEYKNVIYFSGHSHWMFEMEIYNENLNYSNFDGEYCHMVHIPSVCETRWIGENDTSRTSKTGEASEGWIVEVCDEAIILIPVDFISEIFYTEYMKIIPLSK